MTALAVRARAVVQANPDQVGFWAIVAFLVLTSLRDIYLWSIFQDVSPLHVAVLAFGLSGLCFVPVTVARHRHELRVLARCPVEALVMTVACAVSWIAYFCALRTLEPSLAQMFCAAMGPVIADLATWRNPATRGTRAELALHAGIVASLVLAVGLELGARSPEAARLASLGQGVGLALVSGITLAIYRIACSGLNQKGIAPVTILAVRSPIIAVIAAALAWSSGDTALGDWSPGRLALVSANCLLLIVLPIYVNQIGVALASPVTAGVASALQPTLLFGLQVALRADGRVAPSESYGAVSILVYSCFAVASSIVRGQGSRDVQVLQPEPPAQRAAPGVAARRAAPPSLARDVAGEPSPPSSARPAVLAKGA